MGGPPPAIPRDPTLNRFTEFFVQNLIVCMLMLPRSKWNGTLVSKTILFPIHLFAKTPGLLPTLAGHFLQNSVFLKRKKSHVYVHLFPSFLCFSSKFIAPTPGSQRGFFGFKKNTKMCLQRLWKKEYTFQGDGMEGFILGGVSPQVKTSHGWILGVNYCSFFFSMFRFKTKTRCQIKQKTYMEVMLPVY